MRRAVALGFALALAAVLAAPAAAGDPSPFPVAAKIAARDYLGVLLTSQPGSAPVRVRSCRQVTAKRARCSVSVKGTASCRALLDVRVRGGDYLVYAERLRCR